jgi:hypothetical protein
MMLHWSRTKLAIITVLALSLGAAGALTVSGSAQSIGGARTVHFVATAKSGFESKGPFGTGSIEGFRESDKLDDGTSGHDVGVCTITDLRRKKSFCQIGIVLPEGQLILEGPHRETANTTNLAVVGGTGAYADARGSAIAKDIAPRKTDVTVNLVG